MVAVADYVNGIGLADGPPPPGDLLLGFQIQRWGALPSAGGLRDQPAGLMKRVTALMAVYDVYMGQRNAQSLKEWIDNYPQQYQLWSEVEEMRNG